MTIRRLAVCGLALSLASLLAVDVSACRLTRARRRGCSNRTFIISPAVPVTVETTKTPPANAAMALPEWEDRGKLIDPAQLIAPANP